MKKKLDPTQLLSLIIAGIAVQLFIYHYREWREAKKITG